MTFLFVTLLWLVAFGTAGYFTVQLPALKRFRTGWIDIWQTITEGRDATESLAESDRYYSAGVMAGLLTVAIAIVAVVVLFLASLVWAW